MPYAALNEKEKNIVRHIFSLHTTTRQKLCTYTRYTLPTVYRITDDLLRRKIIEVSGIAEETIKGRPTEKIGMSTKTGRILCIHIERTGYSTALADFGLHILSRRTHAFTEAVPPENVILSIVNDYKTMLAECKVQDKDVLGIGVAIVGPIDYVRKQMLQPIHFQAGNWAGVPFIDMLHNCFNKPVEYNCNASACLQGHYYGDLYGKYKNLAYITLGTGIGSGMILNGKPHMHHIVLDGLAHMTIELNGKKCYCGSYGCAEAYVNKYAIIEDCQKVLKTGQESCMQKHIDTLTIEDIANALEQNDAVAHAVVRNAAAVFSCCLVNYLRITDLQAVILGGSLIESLPFFYDYIMSATGTKKIDDITLLRGKDESKNTLRGIASQFILNNLLQ